jgi:uncharacterized repeat protein (TIGR01451 family)
MNPTKYRPIVFILAAGGLLALVMILLVAQPGRAAGPWYVAPGGSDSNSCLSPGAACATINGAIGKASSGDTIYVATGTYTGSGDEVVLLDKSATLSGGWDAGFTTQSDTSTIDGEEARRGLSVSEGVTATVDCFSIQNGYTGGDGDGGGICNGGTLTLSNSNVSRNTANGSGGGINNEGTLTLNNSNVSGNTANGNGGGIFNSGALTLKDSAVSRNTAGVNGGGINNFGTLTLNNSTVSGNMGSGIYNGWGGSFYLNSSTISNNTLGIYNAGTVVFQNSILAGNIGSSAPDCSGALYGTILSSGYNLVGYTTSACDFTPGPGDLTNVSANLGSFVGSPGYHPLLSGSLAIDAGNPAGCTDHLGNPLDTDQRGAARVGRCDMGAYEYTPPGPPASIHAFGGTPQYTSPSNAFDMPLQAAVLDTIGSPVSNTLVTFFAPASGASGTFADSGTFTTTVVTDEGGVATAATFTANGLEGSYVVTATVSGVDTPANFLLSNIRFYVAPGGSDSSDCLSPTTACATINGALSKLDPMLSTTILVATGTYTDTGTEVVLVNKSVTLSGGWDASFVIQSGTSAIDGEETRRGITVDSSVTAIVERFTVQNSSGGILNDGTLTLNYSTVRGNSGGGIFNSSTATLNHCALSDNTGHGILNGGGAMTLNSSTVSGNTADEGGGIMNEGSGTMTLNSSSVSDNAAREGGGIYNGSGTVILNDSSIGNNSSPKGGGGIFNGGTMTLNSSTVSSNTTYSSGYCYECYRGGGIYNSGSVNLNNSTVVSNKATGETCIPTCEGGGIYNRDGGVTLHNTILAGNTADTAGPDCAGTIGIGSLGYNLVGNTSGCVFLSTTGDLTNVDARLGLLQDNGGPTETHALLPGSPAIDTGDDNACPATDQRGVPRPQMGQCDIGAVEMQELELSSKTVNASTASYGTPLIYTISLKSISYGDVSNVVVTDTVPVSLTIDAESLSATSGSYGYAEGIITWMGSVPANVVVDITYRATVNQTAPLGTSITNSAVISGGGEIVTRTATVDVIAQVFLPTCAHNYCPDFFDDFSNPASGWEVVNDRYVRSEYLNGEYRILTKRTGYFYLFRAPACDRQNYTVEADARWVGTPGASYGLVFGITSGFEQYYLFDINTDYREFDLVRRDPGGFTQIVGPTDSAAINGGTASNHLKVTRNGDQITLEVNGTVLGTWSDGTIGGWTWAGLVTNPYSGNPTSDARFDNFSVVSLAGGAASAREPGGVMAEESERAAPNAWRVPAPIDMRW